MQTAPETPRDEITIRSRSPFSGAKVANLSPALADELQLQNVDEGVVILDVDNGSYASNLGFQRGDLRVRSTISVSSRHGIRPGRARTSPAGAVHVGGGGTAGARRAWGIVTPPWGSPHLYPTRNTFNVSDIKSTRTDR